MNRKYRKTVIAGNWKMNKLASEVKAYAEQIKPVVSKAKWCDTVICVPFVMIPAAIRAFKDTRIAVGAQDVSCHESGAYTGEVSADQLKDLGVKYVIIGHSERRQYHGETDAIVNQKVNIALSHGLRPIVCVGESLQHRETGTEMEFVSMQVKLALHGVAADKIKKVIIAYEPIWAIGTGKTATAQQAEEICHTIRSVIRGIYGARIARAVTIQYGGSMNADNSAELLSMLDVDGGLIGGAALKPEEFVKIVEAAV